jgi:hypothetical protein
MTPEGVQKETGVRSGVHKIRGHEIRGHEIRGHEIRDS